MNDYEVKNLGDPTTPLSAVNRKWVKDEFSSMKSAFIMKGDINMGGNEVNHLGDPTTPLSVVSRSWMERKTISKRGDTMIGILNMNSNIITDLGNPVSDSDCRNKKWVEDEITSLENGFTMKGDINMDNNEIKNVGTPTTDSSAATKKWVEDKLSSSSGGGGLSSSGFTMTGAINMDGWTIDNLSVSSPSNPNDKSVPNVLYVKNNFMSKSGGLILGDIDIGDSSDIMNLRDPTHDKSAVPKKWIEDRFYGKNQHV